MINWRILNFAGRKSIDMIPQIVKRTYELCEQRGRQDGRAVQEWEQA